MNETLSQLISLLTFDFLVLYAYEQLQADIEATKAEIKALAVRS